MIWLTAGYQRDCAHSAGNGFGQMVGGLGGNGRDDYLGWLVTFYDDFQGNGLGIGDTYIRTAVSDFDGFNPQSDIIS